MDERDGPSWNLPRKTISWLTRGNSWTISRWWFQTFFIFTPTWGRFPFWLIFFRWVETTNQILSYKKPTTTTLNFPGPLKGAGRALPWQNWVVLRGFHEGKYTIVPLEHLGLVWRQGNHGSKTLQGIPDVRKDFIKILMWCPDISATTWLELDLEVNLGFAWW